MTVLVLLLGCGVGENHFWKEQADVWCDNKKKCDGQGFDDEFDGKGDCKDWFLKENDAVRTSYEDCEYDAGAAGDCLHGLKKQDCDEWSNEVPDGCNEVYDCLE